MTRARELADQAIPSDNAHLRLKVEQAILQALREALGEPSESMIEAAGIADAEYTERQLGSLEVISHLGGYDHWTAMARQRLADWKVEPK